MTFTYCSSYFSSSASQLAVQSPSNLLAKSSRFKKISFVNSTQENWGVYRADTDRNITNTINLSVTIFISFGDFAFLFWWINLRLGVGFGRLLVIGCLSPRLLLQTFHFSRLQLTEVHFLHVNSAELWSKAITWHVLLLLDLKQPTKMTVESARMLIMKLCSHTYKNTQ